MFREPDLIDVWFDSGAMPLLNFITPLKTKVLLMIELISCRFYCGGGVIKLGLVFYTTLFLVCFDSVAFKSVISNGLVLDSFGQKMSKRLGNVINPFDLIGKYGSDPVRWYMLTNANPWENIKFNVDGVEEVRRKFLAPSLIHIPFFLYTQTLMVFYKG